MRIFANTISLNSGNRGLEIKSFLENEKYGKADNYLILDDEVRDIEKEFDDKHIINTDFNNGFDDKKLQEAMQKVKG